jgi:hypothetical protein
MYGPSYHRLRDTVTTLSGPQISSLRGALSPYGPIQNSPYGIGFPRMPRGGADCDGLRKLWLGGGHRMAVSDNTWLSSRTAAGNSISAATVVSIAPRCGATLLLSWFLLAALHADPAAAARIYLQPRVYSAVEAKSLSVMGEALCKRRHGTALTRAGVPTKPTSRSRAVGCYLYRAIDRDRDRIDTILTG